eukprot:TRINITY_DN16732_c0_g1_i2.p2 TRINITY_DN16732_c0_g1~~TRINITY_DN16732_c0_g1_i2.p2  ORF type:complete len:127 (+),score=6.92 TRINITY_DN16732_c0_g1_i2:169-549(+)
MTTLIKLFLFFPFLYAQYISPTFTKTSIDHTTFPSAVPNYPELFQTIGATTFLIGHDSVQNCYVLKLIKVQDPVEAEVSFCASVVVPFEVPCRLCSSDFCARRCWDRGWDEVCCGTCRRGNVGAED